MAISKIIGSGLGTINSPVEFTSADNLTQLTLTSTDADANTGPRLDITRNSASPAANDILGQIRFLGEDAADNSLSYVSIFGQLIDPTDSSEDGSLEIDVRLAGTNRSRIISNATETIFNDDSVDIDFRVESNGNANMLFVDGGNNRVGIGTNTPQVGTLHVHTATAGTVTASTKADDLVIENSAETGITILSPDDQSARIRFSSPSTNTDVGGASILYRQNINLLKVGTAVAGGILRLTSGADVEALNIDGNGVVTKPKQPAFQANIDSTQANINGTVKINFATQVFDQGNNFQPGTGDGQGGDTSNKTATFAAPATGKYQLNVSIRLENIDSAAGYYQVSIITSNRNYRYIFDPDFGQDNAFFTPSISILADMDEDDTAFVQIQQSGGSAQTDMHPETYFSGYLVC